MSITIFVLIAGLIQLARAFLVAELSFDVRGRFYFKGSLFALRSIPDGLQSLMASAAEPPPLAGDQGSAQTSSSEPVSLTVPSALAPDAPEC